MPNSTNVNITVKITIYIPVYSITLRITRISILTFSITLYDLSLFHHGDLKYSHKVNLLVLRYLWGHLVPIMYALPVHKHTQPPCILFSMIELLLYTVHSNSTWVSQLYPLLYHIVYFLKCYVILLTFMLEYMFINNSWNITNIIFLIIICVACVIATYPIIITLYNWTACEAIGDQSRYSWYTGSQPYSSDMLARFSRLWKDLAWHIIIKYAYV